MVDDVLLLVFVIGVDMAMVQLMMRRCETESSLVQM